MEDLVLNIFYKCLLPENSNTTNTYEILKQIISKEDYLQTAASISLSSKNLPIRQFAVISIKIFPEI